MGDGRYRGFWDWSDEPEEAEEPVPSFHEVMEAVRAGEVGDPYGYVLETVRERIRAGNLLTTAQLDHPGEEEEHLVHDLALEVARDYAASCAGRSLPRLPAEPEVVAKRVVDDILGWGPLAELMTDETVEEIFINGPDEIWVVRAGRPKERTPLRFTDGAELRRFFNRKLDRAGGHRGLSTKTPWADGRLEDGSRFHGIMPPLVANRATEALQRIGEEAVPALCAALTDECDAVRIHAAKALAAIQSLQSVTPLCQAYLHDPNYLVQHYTAEALTAMGVIEMVAVS